MKKVLFIFLILVVGISGLVLPYETAQAGNCSFSNCEGENAWGLQCGTANGIPVFTGFNELFCCVGNNETYATREECQVGACAPSITPTTPTTPTTTATTTTTTPTTPSGPSIVSGGGSVEIQNPLEHDTFEDLVDAIVKFVFYLAMAIAPLMIIVAGFFFLTSAGDPKKIETAKAVLMYTLVGLAICIMATAIIKLINDVLGV